MNATQLRWALTLTNDHNPADVIHTFTWGVTYKAAYVRVTEQIDSPVWEGYSFELAKTPSGS